MTLARTGTLIAALSLSATALALPAGAQQGPGREGVLSYGTGLDFDFEDGLSSTTDVGVTLRTRTAVDQFELRFGTELFGDFTDSGTDDFAFRNRYVNTTFARRVANSALNFSAGYTETDLDDDVDTAGPVIIITDTGELATTRATLGFQTGIAGPFGLSFDARYRDSNYSNTIDPDLEDEVEIGADVLARFALSRTLDLRARAGISQIDEDDLFGTERQSTFVGVGVGGTNGQGLTFTADLLFDRSEVTTTAPVSSSTDDGLGFDIDVSQARPDGSAGVRLASRVDDTGRRTEASVLRRFDRPTGGLSLSLGVVDQEGDDTLRPIGSLAYSRDSGDGQTISARIGQHAGSRNGGTVVSTSVDLNYSRDINGVSGWSAGLGFFATDDLGGGDYDDRTTASLAYRRDITPEWSMNTGYSFSRDSDGDEANSVFFNVTRDITFGF